MMIRLYWSGEEDSLRATLKEELYWSDGENATYSV